MRQFSYLENGNKNAYLIDLLEGLSEKKNKHLKWFKEFLDHKCLINVTYC